MRSLIGSQGPVPTKRVRNRPSTPKSQTKSAESATSSELALVQTRPNCRLAGNDLLQEIRAERDFAGVRAAARKFLNVRETRHEPDQASPLRKKLDESESSGKPVACLASSVVPRRGRLHLNF
jgi:hypothetical protein